MNLQESRLGKINENYKIYLQNTSPKSSATKTFEPAPTELEVDKYIYDFLEQIL